LRAFALCLTMVSWYSPPICNFIVSAESLGTGKL
jgi:hypothetical protein